jgi:hypothetical protein
VENNDPSRRLRILPPATMNKVAKAVANLSVGTEERSMAKVAPPECDMEASTDQEKVTEAVSINSCQTRQRRHREAQKFRKRASARMGMNLLTQ